MTEIEGTCAGQQEHALKWHVHPFVVANALIEGIAKACGSYYDAFYLTSRTVSLPYSWVGLTIAFAAVPSRTDSAFLQHGG
eukprot:750169-Pleurochrysis_carterae.AAC.1